MAEAAGLAVGVLALISTFKDCIDLFSHFAAARSLGRDYELLSAKLDIEKTLLLQWAHRTNLLKPQYDKRLDDPNVRPAVAQALSSIRLLLGDSQILRQRYGLQEVDGGELISMVPSVSKHRMSSFAKDFGKLDLLLKEFESLDLRIDRHRRASYKLKARWAIWDKTKFGELLQELSYFVSKVHDLIPDSLLSARIMSEEDLTDFRSMEMLRVVHEAASERERVLADVAEESLVNTCQKRIVKCIWFRLMDDRRDSLAFPNPESLNWLEHGSGFYWICGKAGSGKSTLMKYISSSEKVKILLENWAGNTPLTVASFFFWYLGSDEQKSQQGLSRALLFKILNSERSLIPQLLPKMWQEAYGTDTNVSLPSNTEIRQAFEQLGNPQFGRRKFCLFIDGLDEYSGKPTDGVDFLKCLITNPNVKIIVSSRPIPICVQEFSKEPKLYLQDLTRGDMATYIRQTIDSHPYMHTLRDTDCAQAMHLNADLIEKSSGVFLWVVLACRSLLDGFANFDRWSDLRQRINELPPELEQPFKHMLGKIEGRYQTGAAKLLQICHQNCVLPGVQRLSTLGLALVDDHDMDLIKVPFYRFIGRAERNTKCLALEGRLRSHCCGLIETKPRNSRRNDSCFCQPVSASCLEGRHSSLIDGTVEFMHRSVFDFLGTQGFDDLVSRVKDQDQRFDANAVLSCISLHLTDVSLGSALQGRRHIGEVLLYIMQTNKVEFRSISNIFSRLHSMITEFRSSKCFRHIFLNMAEDVISDLKSSDRYFGIILAVEAGMLDFVQAYDTEEGQRLSGMPLARPLLCYALEPPFLSELSNQHHSPSVEMIAFILSVGCDPNQSFGTTSGSQEKTTPWKRLLERVCETSRVAGAFSLQTTKMFVRAGADLHAGKLFVRRYYQKFRHRKRPSEPFLQKVLNFLKSLDSPGDGDDGGNSGDSVQSPSLPPVLTSKVGRKRARSLSPTALSSRNKLTKR